MQKGGRAFLDLMGVCVLSMVISSVDSLIASRVCCYTGGRAFLC